MSLEKDEKESGPIGPEKPAKPRKRRAIVYVDGFNFYNGSIKGTPHKWLDLQKYFDMLRPNDEVVWVKYFTAPMSGSSGQRQNAYLQALATRSRVKIALGKYKSKRVRCQVSACDSRGDRRFSTYEEKRTDVNIALAILDDAYQGDCEIQIVVSGDSDLVPAIHIVKRRFPSMQITAYIPARDPERGAAVEIRGAADKDRTLPLNFLGKAHLPAELDDGSGNTISRPHGW